MRFSKRVAGAALAGVLACSLAAAPLAMAAEGGLLKGMTAGEEAAAEVVAYETHTYGPVAVQLPADLSIYEEVYEDAAAGQVETENAMMQIMLQPESLIGAEEELVAQGVAELQYMMADYTEVVNDAYYLDGILFRNIVATGTFEGVPIEGYSTFVFGADWTFVMLTVQFDAGAGMNPAYARAHATVGLVPAGATVEPVAPVEPTEPVAPAEPTEPVAPAAGAFEATVEGWTFASAGDPAVVVDENEWSDFYGMEILTVPMTVTNGTGEPSDPWVVSYYFYGPDGVEVEDAGWYFDNSLNNLGSMRPNATASCVLCIPYTGEGVYTVQFIDWDNDVDQFLTVTMGTPAPAVPAPTGGFVCDGWTIVPGEGYVMGVVENEWSDYLGMEVVAVPVTVYNGSDGITSPWWDLSVTWYGSAGIEVDTPEYDFADSFKSLGNMLPGAQAECFFYFLYDGDGEYAVAFDAWDDDSYNEITVNVVK